MQTPVSRGWQLRRRTGGTSTSYEVPRWLRVVARTAYSLFTRLPTLALSAGLGFLLAFLLFRPTDPDFHPPALNPPDIPPAEYVYLDSARVLAYLGQIEGGLSSGEKRSRLRTERLTASITARGAEVGGASKQTVGSEQTITQTEADRFFRLLQLLRQIKVIRGRSEPLLTEFKADLAQESASDKKEEDKQQDEREDRQAEKMRTTLRGVKEGDFVRIRAARLFLPPYAAIYPRVRYAASFTRGGFGSTRALTAPVTRQERREVQSYLKGLGANARLPLVVPTLRGDARVREAVTFLVPVRYQFLGKEPSLLSGNVEVLGKLVYKDPRLASEVRKTTAREPAYVDRQTLATFGPKLLTTSPDLLEKFGLSRDRSKARRSVLRSMTFRAPVAVVVPVAIYQ